ncbi:transglycosylase SLT domain-containing protein, partial [bacterium]|nr:transglycosylase SLT domain-containing protein [bacterium]
KRTPRYFPLFGQEIRALNLPDDLRFLAVAESSLIEGIHSRAGAAGLWQFMRHTGRRLGLRITSDIDERLDPIAATRCALKYLKFLKEKFSSWPLALAAYNCGEKRVSDAIKRQKTDNYFALSLPEESERYLYRMAAIKLILTNPTEYGYNISDDQFYPPLKTDYISLNLKNEFSLVDFAIQLGSTYHSLRKLNPHLINKRLPKGKFNLGLPEGYKNRATSTLRGLAPLSTQRSHYLVKKGDTLGAISRRFNISMKRLRKLNRLKSSKIMVGQKLRLKQ